MKPRVLVLDDGEVPTADLCEVLRQAGAEVIRVLDFFEAQRLLDSHHFDALVGHEIFLLLAREMKLASRLCLLAPSPHEWTPEQLEFLGVSEVVSGAADAAIVLRAVGL